ncbi:MAG: hypothetical protein LBL96_05055 [Clostridiales bacterium]|jgi:hypothetical protein|nr:hypothetical protein [Clostridiales bacterium]
MVQFIAGGRGEGKSKRLIAMANDSVRTSDGHVVYIDDDSTHTRELSHSIRFVETSNFPLSNYREFIGFVCGILSQDYDITCIYVDGLTNIVKRLPDEDLLKLVKKLESLVGDHLDFIISMNCKAENLPDEVKKLLAS